MMNVRLRIIEAPTMTVDLMPDGVSLRADFTLPSGAPMVNVPAPLISCIHCKANVQHIMDSLGHAIACNQDRHLAAWCPGKPHHVWTIAGT